MSFSTMNGLQAARTGGLSGTRRAPIQAQQQPLQNPVDPGAVYDPTNRGGTGQMGQFTSPERTRFQRNGLMGTPSMVGQGMGMPAAMPRTGVAAPAPPTPSAVPQQAPVQFDPRDPRNAALAGYMNGA